MTAISPREARRCYNAHHPVHAAYYFSPEHDDTFASLGLERGPMAYLAGRAAPFGPVGPGVVTATFYNFHPDLVARHLPHAWGRASPVTVLEARLRIANAYLTRLLGAEAIASPEMAEAAELALLAAEGCNRPGRPLYSANADLPVPTAPHLALWHAATLLREYRGDGHVRVVEGGAGPAAVLRVTCLSTIGYFLGIEGVSLGRVSSRDQSAGIARGRGLVR